ncbi:MAG: peptidoglycan-binding protein [Woeseia sp.]|nr:peptidoglycan-binding protein [Woeseia sp.]
MIEDSVFMSPDILRPKKAASALIFFLVISLTGCSSVQGIIPANSSIHQSDSPSRAPDNTTNSSSSIEIRGAAPQAKDPEPPVLLSSGRTVPLSTTAPDLYIVKKGDTLWDIAATFLRDPWYWPEVWYVNPQIDNPHLIYPGDTLALVTIDGRQRIMNVQGSTYRLSPQARVMPLTESITSIPYENISSFLSQGLVLEKNEITDLPYILATRGDHLVAAAGNEVYIRGGKPAPNGTRYSIVHVGEELRDPDDNTLIGYHGIHVGEGSLSRGGDPATVSLTATNREVVVGDRMIPGVLDVPLNFFPKAPDQPIAGQIISVVDGVSLIGQYQVVVINRGARHGLLLGDVLTVLQTGPTVVDRYKNGSLPNMGRGELVKLPDEAAGSIMIFKIYDRVSYALVMEATSDIHIFDLIRNPN